MVLNGLDQVIQNPNTLLEFSPGPSYEVLANVRCFLHSNAAAVLVILGTIYNLSQYVFVTLTFDLLLPNHNDYQ